MSHLLVGLVAAITVGKASLAASAAMALAAAYLASAAVQPLVRKLAVVRGLLDYPSEERHRHETAVPRLGGVGVFVGLLVATAIGAALDAPEHVIRLLPFVLSILAGATILFVTGLVDDLRGVPPLVKLGMQTIAALIVYQFGFRIQLFIVPPGHYFSLGMLALPVTVLWIVGLSNAFNLVDGADGLAGSVAVIALAATAISAWVVHDTTIVLCSLALMGALGGFLRYNLPPARIFLGDSGSLVVGFLLAILTVKGMSRHGAVFVLAPVFALSYPLLDTGISMLRRWLRGDPLSRADGRHIHHQLRKMGLGARQSLGVVCLLSSIIAVLGLMATFAPPQVTIAVAVAGAAVLTLIFVYGARWLQYHELLEAGALIRTAARSGRSRLRDKIHARDIARLIEYANTTQELAAIIEDSADTFHFAHMQLRWGTNQETPPSNIIADMQLAALWVFDYPVLAQSGFTDPLFLSIWCNVNHHRPAGAERVAQILALALAEWVRRHEEQVYAVSVVADGAVIKFTPRVVPQFADRTERRERLASDGRRRATTMSSPS